MMDTLRAASLPSGISEATTGLGVVPQKGRMQHRACGKKVLCPSPLDVGQTTPNRSDCWSHRFPMPWRILENIPRRTQQMKRRHSYSSTDTAAKRARKPMPRHSAVAWALWFRCWVA